MTPDTMLLVLLMRALGGGVDVEPLAIGDQGRAKCALQVHHAPREALTDAGVCVRAGLYILRASMRLCPAQPLAAYAGARCGSDIAGRITRDRDRVRKVALRRVLGVMP